MCYNDLLLTEKGLLTAMPRLTLQQRLSEITSLIDNNVFQNDQLVYSFVLHLCTNREIDECMDFVKTLWKPDNEKYWIFYRLWNISLIYLRGDFAKAKQEFFLLPMDDIPDPIMNFYLKKLGFDKLYDDFIIEETEHFIFHIHPKRYENREDIFHKMKRRELGVELVCKDFFGLALERKIHYFLWSNDEMREHFFGSHTCSCYGVIQEGEYNRDFHESTHVYNYLYGLENPQAFILEGIAVYNDGRKGSVRLGYAQAAYQKTGISPDICEWWKNAEVLRKTNSWITYTTAGYFVLKLQKKYGKEKLLRLAKYQSYEDGCSIYGESTLLDIIRETENEIMSLQAE